MAAEGHQIGNHTFNHVNLAQMSDAGACEELTLCYEEIFSAVGAGEGSEGEAYFAIRPPFGEIGASVRENVDSPVILWSVDTRDWTGMGAEDIADYIVKTAGEGDIILLHDIFENSVAGALMAIDTMMENGYTFVTVDEMFENKGISLEPGKGVQKGISLRLQGKNDQGGRYVKDWFPCGNEREGNVFRISQRGGIYGGKCVYGLYRRTPEYPEKTGGGVKY